MNKTAHNRLKMQLLAMLAEQQPLEDIDFRPIATWIIEANLAAAMFELVGKRSRFDYPQIQKRYYTNIFRATVQQTVFAEIADHLHQKRIDIVLLKGAAITPIAWNQPYLRYQADIDFMVPRHALATVSTYLTQAGFIFRKPQRIGKHFDDLPETNKEGQLELVLADKNGVSIEVHSEVFLGHVQRIATERHEAGLWARKVVAKQPDPSMAGRPLWRLSDEDLLLHVLVHTAINHQFDKHVGRNFIDLIRLAHRLTIDWGLLYEQIRTQKVTTAVWLALSLMQEIFGETPYTPLHLMLSQHVGRVRGWLLKRLLNREHILNLYLINRTKWRYVLLLLMIDQVGDMLRVCVRLPSLKGDFAAL